MSVTVESPNAPREELRQVNDPVEREKMRDASQESRREISSTTAPQSELDEAINAASERRAKEKWTPAMEKVFKKRISTYTRQTREAQDRARAAEERLAETEKRQPGGQESKPGAHSTEQRPANGASSDDAGETAEFQSRVEAARTKYSDYEEVIKTADSKGVQIHPDFGQALKKLPNGPDVAYHLAKHPELVGEAWRRLNGKPQAEQKALAAQLAHELGQRVQHSQQFPRAQQFNQRLESLKKERGFQPSDLHKAINIHGDAVRVLHEAENGPDCVLYLADNLGEAEAIGKMTPARQALAIAKLSAKLEGPQREAPKTRVSPPPRPVGGSANTSAYDPYKEQPKNHQQYMAWRKTQGRTH
jgi:hypothetical protein